MSNISKMNKADLIKHGESVGVTLPSTATKKDLIIAIKTKSQGSKVTKAKVTSKKKAKKVIVGTSPASLSGMIIKKAAAPKSVWTKVKEYFNV